MRLYFQPQPGPRSQKQAGLQRRRKPRRMRLEKGFLLKCWLRNSFFPPRISLWPPARLPHTRAAGAGFWAAGGRPRPRTAAAAASFPDAWNFGTDQLTAAPFKLAALGAGWPPAAGFSIPLRVESRGSRPRVPEADLVGVVAMWRDSSAWPPSLSHACSLRPLRESQGRFSISVKSMWLLTGSCWEEREAGLVSGKLHNWGVAPRPDPQRHRIPWQGGRERTLHGARPRRPSACHTHAPPWG